MNATNRFGTAAFLAGALGLAALMAYTLVGVDLGTPSPSWGSPPEWQVAVVFPDPSDWHDFRQGIASCEAKGLLRVTSRDEGAVAVATPRLGRALRFRFVPARGVVETRDEVRRLAESADPPIAFVGSSNTTLTSAMADVLRTIGGGKAGGPVLLVPWATSVAAEGSRTPLLASYPGHVFRMCPNNRREAGLVVGCLASRAPKARPSRVFLVSDPADPYSADLAGCFREAIAGAVPGADVAESTDVVGQAGPDDEPSARDAAWASKMVASLEALPADRPAWLVLPLQEQPTRRLLRALTASLRGADVPRLEVLCGDGIGLETLGEFAGPGAPSLWCVTAASDFGAAPDAPQDVQVSAEVVASLVWGLDRGTASASALHDGLASLDLAADDPSAMGRSLGFTAEGERKGQDLGRVLHLEPGRREVLAYAKGPEGNWTAPVAIPAPDVGTRR